MQGLDAVVAEIGSCCPLADSYFRFTFPLNEPVAHAADVVFRVAASAWGPV
jgi:hypothetical protein